MAAEKVQRSSQVKSQLLKTRPHGHSMTSSRNRACFAYSRIVDGNQRHQAMAKQSELSERWSTRVVRGGVETWTKNESPQVRYMRCRWRWTLFLGLSLSLSLSPRQGRLPVVPGSWKTSGAPRPR